MTRLGRWPLVVALSLGCATGARGMRQPVAARSGIDDSLWATSGAPYLQQLLWATGDRYYATNYLMVPLHAAFYENRSDWQGAFADHFRRFVAAVPKVAVNDTTELSWLQYSYLLSEFVALAASRHRNLIPAGAVSTLAAFIHDEWSVRPALKVGGPPFTGGLRARLDWKLKASAPKGRSWAIAINDQERFVFAIAADLRRYEMATGSTTPWTDELSSILNVARSVFRARVVNQSDGGWLFQPGVWADHPDYRYVGQSATAKTVTAAPLRDVAEDVSHSHRMPLWLTSLAMAVPAASADRTYYLGLRAALGRQFLTKVVVKPSPASPLYRTNNFMDGRNGLYRWRNAKTRSYAPFELSTTMTLGWWTFLEEPEVRSIYQDFGRQFASPDMLRRYFGQGSDEAAAPSTGGVDMLAFRYLLVRLASRLYADGRGAS